MKLAPFNDQPVLGCDLDRSVWVKKIALNIKDSTPPKSFAIHGT